ncbi:hypothetical protein [Sphingobium sp. MK2]|uniref:hypothetical protein n=1 Tax=Sphingobium sp. MK2 TaxID=3116540 RepID=UPI0032E35B69
MVNLDDHRMQTLTLDTISGPKPLPAPGGWQFDETATTVWSWLLTYTDKRSQPLKTQRDGHVLDGQIYALSIILANVLGMAPPYWMGQAKEFVDKMKN